MTPEEKAKELIERFSFKPISIGRQQWSYDPKACALICVDEIITAAETPPDTLVYWQSVKTEIEKT